LLLFAGSVVLLLGSVVIGCYISPNTLPFLCLLDFVCFKFIGHDLKNFTWLKCFVIWCPNSQCCTQLAGICIVCILKLWIK